MWHTWCKVLGQKATERDKDLNKVVIIRTLILITYMITNAFIVAGVARHWNDGNSTTAEIQLEVEVQDK
jgi:hypothetical protein